jgi:plasmid maintenance system antidote protein VapI
MAERGGPRLEVPAEVTLTLAVIGSCGTQPSEPMALRLGRYCGNGPDLWLSMQTDHDLWHAERTIGPTLRKIPVKRAA